MKLVKNDYSLNIDVTPDKVSCIINCNGHSVFVSGTHEDFITEEFESVLKLAIDKSNAVAGLKTSLADLDKEYAELKGKEEKIKPAVGKEKAKKAQTKMEMPEKPIGGPSDDDTPNDAIVKDAEKTPIVLKKEPPTVKEQPKPVDSPKPTEPIKEEAKSTPVQNAINFNEW